MNMADALHTFLAESRALLQEMEEALLKLENDPADPDAVHAVFRAAHTIKGSAGLFGLDHIVDFTHEAESVLDRARGGEMALDDELTGLLLECSDHLGRLLDIAADGAEPDEDDAAHGAALTRRLAVYLERFGEGEQLPVETGAAEPRIDSAGPGPDGVENCAWHISLRFGRDVLRNGMDPMSFIRYLATFGEIVHVVTLPDAMPPAAEMDPECCYLGFEIRFRTDADKARIESAFDFVREDSAIRILPPGCRIGDYLELIESLPEDTTRLGEILVGCGAITPRELDEMLAIQEAQGGEKDEEGRPPLGEMFVQENVVQPEVVDAALARQKEVRGRQAQDSKFLRVHADKLDNLINLVGELVIANSGLGMLAARNKDGATMEAVSGVARLVEDIRDSTMRLRLVEIGETFNRFRRVVRDVSKETGKEIELVIQGGDTELDKTMVDRIGDPLTHLVRNAVDHGIEAAEVRAGRGKPAKGTVWLNAYHESGGIVIEVADDGGGLDQDAILAKAQARGVVAEGDELTDAQVWNLIFEPGFSTVDRVSNLSGRGVGMDVVKRAIEALRGTVGIESHAGRGTTFRIRLPLSMAIIDGFLMSVAAAHYVVPLELVLECVELPAGEGDADNRNYLNLRGEVLPLLRLKEHFALEGERTGRRRNVVVVQWAGRKAGLLVDELKGQLQAVIKPLGRVFSGLRGISGSTILGSGEVALVLDVPVLLEQAVQKEDYVAAQRIKSSRENVRVARTETADQ